MAARRKVGELQEYKDRRRRQREMNNLEERMLLDQISEGHRRKPAPAVAVGNRDRLPLAKDKDVRQLQIEVRLVHTDGQVDQHVDVSDSNDKDQFPFHI